MNKITTIPFKRHIVSGYVLLGTIVMLTIILIAEAMLIYKNSEAAFKSELLVKCTRFPHMAGINENVYTLVRMEKGVCVPMFSYKGKDTSAYHIQWKNYIFLGTPTYADNAKVFMIDTISNVVTNLFDNRIIEYSSKSTKPNYQFTEFNIIDNTLYFVPIGYDGSRYTSTIYYLDLPPTATSNAEKVVNLPERFSRPKQVGKYTFLITKSNDDCLDNYSFFNSSQKTVGKFVGSFVVNVDDCLSGEMLIADDGESNFIVADAIPSNPTVKVKPGDTLWDMARKYLGSGSRWKKLKGYSDDPKKLSIGLELGIPTGHIVDDPRVYDQTDDYTIYTSLSLMLLSDPSKRISLLTNSTMPKDISWIVYKKEENKVYLSGKDLYVYDIQSKSLTKILNLTTSPNERFQTGYVNGDVLCMTSVVVGDEEIQASTIFLNQKTKTITKRTIYDACYNDKAYDVQMQRPNVKNVNTTLLPSNYAIVVTPK